MLATASGYTTGTSASFTVTGLVAISSVTVSSSASSPSANFYFTITVNIYDSAGAATQNSCTTALTESGGNAISGTTSSTLTGSGTFSVYMAVAGSRTIVATCSSVTGNVAITVLSEYLTVTSYTPVVIFM